jgi:hypothetical protein
MKHVQIVLRRGEGRRGRMMDGVNQYICLYNYYMLINFKNKKLRFNFIKHYSPN